jgi:diacylglycerol kinase family enzyme
MPAGRVLIVANPISGRGRSTAVANELVRALAARGRPAELYSSRARGDLATRARALEPGADMIVACGGDGTLREVLEGLPGRSIPVGHLPCGTANVLARELGLPRDVPRALDVLLAGRTRALDTASANGRLCCLIASAGFDARVVREIEARRDGPIQAWAYVPATWHALRGYRAPRLFVRIDDGARRGPYGFVFVTNAKRYAGRVRLEHSARLDDERMEAYLFPSGGFAALASTFARALLTGLPTGDVELQRLRAIRVESDEPVPLEIDGDSAGTTPLELCVAEAPFRIVVP